MRSLPRALLVAALELLRDNYPRHRNTECASGEKPFFFIESGKKKKSELFRFFAHREE